MNWPPVNGEIDFRWFFAKLLAMIFGCLSTPDLLRVAVDESIISRRIVH